MTTFNVKKGKKIDSEIVQTDLRQLNGKIVKPFYLSRFLCKNGKTAYRMLFSIKGDSSDTVYSAFVNDKNFIEAMNEYLDDLAVDKATITGENLQFFKVVVKKDEETGFSFAYVNPM